MLTQLQLLGLDDRHLIHRDGISLHPITFDAFKQLQQAALHDGLDIQIASGYRSFERQLTIFNGKASGKRPVKDDHNRVIPTDNLDEQRLLHAILRFSALPGCSRHHWGSDLDLYDANAVALSELALEPWEYQADGPMYPLSTWLNQHAKQFGFFLPYQQDLGGVAIEPWHLSHAPVSQGLAEQLDIHELAKQLSHSSICLKRSILSELEAIVARYALTITHN